MAQAHMGLYEGMFLLSQQEAASDFAGCVSFLNEVFERAEAELIALTKWDERKLAYTIKGQKRGTYMLAYFRVRGTQIANIERDCNLSDYVLRSMMLKADHIGETELELAKREAASQSVKTKLMDQSEEQVEDMQEKPDVDTKETPANLANQEENGPVTEDKPIS